MRRKLGDVDRKLPIATCQFQLKLKDPLVFGFIVTVLLSCASVHLDPDEIIQMDYFEPKAYIYTVYPEGNSILNDSLSQLASARMDSIILGHSDRFRIRRKLVIEDSKVEAKVAYELLNILAEQYINKESEYIPPTPTIDSVLNANETRFAMVNVIKGFERTEKEYSGENSQKFAIGLLSLNDPILSSTEWNLKTYTVIFDSKNESLAFSEESEVREQKPTEPKVLSSALYNTFRYYFYSR